jgi:hypothetical protein
MTPFEQKSRPEAAGRLFPQRFEAPAGAKCVWWLKESDGAVTFLTAACAPVFPFRLSRFVIARGVRPDKALKRAQLQKSVASSRGMSPMAEDGTSRGSGHESFRPKRTVGPVGSFCPNVKDY